MLTSMRRRAFREVQINHVQSDIIALQVTYRENPKIVNLVKDSQSPTSLLNLIIMSNQTLFRPQVNINLELKSLYIRLTEQIMFRVKETLFPKLFIRSLQKLKAWIQNRIFNSNVIILLAYSCKNWKETKILHKDWMALKTSTMEDILLD